MSQAIRATSDSFEATDKAATCFLAEPSFWFPDRLVPSAWLEHAPFGFWIVAAARPRMLVELGSHHGFSYLVVVRVAVGSEAVGLHHKQLK